MRYGPQCWVPQPGRWHGSSQVDRVGHVGLTNLQAAPARALVRLEIVIQNYVQPSHLHALPRVSGRSPRRFRGRR